MATRSKRSNAGRKANQEFVSEAEEILERMREDLADLDEQRAANGRVDPDLVNRLFRSAHSLKALAGMFGLDPIQDLAHHLEDVLDGLRLGRVALAAPVVAAIDEAVRVFAALLEGVGDDDAIRTAAAPAAALSERLQGLAHARSADGDVLAGLDLDPSLLRALTEYEEHRLRENVQQGRNIFLVDSTFEIISFEEGLGALTELLREVGEVLSTLPAPGETSDAQIRFSLLVATELAGGDLATRVERLGASVREVGGGRAEAEAEIEPERPERAEAPLPSDAPLESLRSISETVRVDIRKLDELMNLVGELVIQRAAITDIVTRLQSSPEVARVGQELAKIQKDLDRKLRAMQSAVLEVRMVPMRQVFDKVSRVVRGLRRDLGKDVRLDVAGADTELDKLIVEELVDPLMHIVRNALDHAIEPVDERRAAGKDAEGRIRIEAYQRGNHVVIAVSDDGAGIDVVALRTRAEAKGLVRPGEDLSEKEVLDLVFAPGVSTRDEVTETSGRGVGMDVVRANVTALGGVVDVESTTGRGTTISMTLPITLAIIQSLVVSVGEHRFAIPMNAVQETLLIDAAEIQHSEGREFLDLRGDPLLLRRLASEFQLPGEAPQKPYAVVVGVGDVRIGLLVDRLDGQQDTVIKPIQGPIPSVRGIAGATELGDQDPVLVLDVASLVEDAMRRREAA